MQTLTLAIDTLFDLDSNTIRNPAAAFYSLETPMVAPFPESPAWIYTRLLHPAMDDFKGSRAVKVEYYVGIGHVDLILDDYPVRCLEYAGAAERVYHSPDQIGLVKRLSSGVSDFTRDRAMTFR